MEQGLDDIGYSIASSLNIAYGIVAILQGRSVSQESDTLSRDLT